MFAPPVKAPAKNAPLTVPARIPKPPQHTPWRPEPGISNQAMLRVQRSLPSVQPKLAIGRDDDPLEREADQTADQIMREPAPEPAIGGAPLQVSRKCAPCEAEDQAEMLQKKTGETSQPAAGGPPGAVYETLRSPGQPLDASTRSYFEPRFGMDFGQVRIHIDSLAHQAAAGVNARAYTVGSDLAFAAGQYAPHTPQGRRLLAHELTHVVQQSGGSTQGVASSGASVARLPISPSGIALHRDQQPNTPTAPDWHRLDRPGAQWPFGPITKHKIAQHDLSTYLGWVKEVEKAYGPDKQMVLQRLRRLYYSSYAGAGGASFDQAIAEQAGAQGAPLDALHISTDALDGLYETNVVRLRDGQLVDVSHVLAGLDVKTAGTTFKADVATALYDVSWLGVVTWAGDLASWFLKWVDQFLTGKLPTPAEDTPLKAAQKVDLLSDMDSQILAAANVRPSTIEHVKAENRPIRYPNVGTELSMPVSALLDQYYSSGMDTAKSKDRFAAFLRAAAPPIPYHTANPDGSGPITLPRDAQDDIYDAIRNTARLFINHGGPYPFGEEILDQHDSQLRYMAQRFWRFLYAGLATGDGPWP